MLILWCFGQKPTCDSQEHLTLEPNVEPLETKHPDLPAQRVIALGQMLGGMAAMQRDQAEAIRQILETLLAQAERQTHALERLAARTAAAPPNTFPLAGVALNKLGWPAAEWAVRLLPLLTGEAQTATLGLPPAAGQSYADVCKAVMDQLGLTPKDHRRRFREATLGPEG